MVRGLRPSAEAAALADSRSAAPVSGPLSTVRSTVRLFIVTVASPKPRVSTSVRNGPQRCLGALPRPCQSLRWHDLDRGVNADGQRLLLRYAELEEFGR